MAKKTKAKPEESAEAPGKSRESLFSSTKNVDPALASLFARSTPWPPSNASKAKVNGKQGPLKLNAKHTPGQNQTDEEGSSGKSEASVEDESDESRSSSSITSSSEEDVDSESYSNREEAGSDGKPSVNQQTKTTLDETKSSRRKRKREDEDLESKYMQRLAQEEAREKHKHEAERLLKRQKASETTGDDEAQDAGDDDDDAQDDSEDDDDANMLDAREDEEQEDGDDDENYQIPQHETLAKSPAAEIEKAKRTIFLGNVSTDAVMSKRAKKALLQHMSSFLSALPKEDSTAHKIESIRFRSTAYTNMLPKKASYVTQDLMDSTTRTTNAYIVYTTKAAAREALKLNGSIVLGRHLRVDSVAHPAKIEPRRCVFIGNLGFVDDDSAIQAAEAEGSGGKKRKPRKKQPSDIEEGLWREFGKCGTVENVRVVRDSRTRVGKGFAYVQFADENAVEAALLYDGKKFPPMLPRKLRVSRAKAMKRNSAKKDTRSQSAANKVYNPKISEQQKSTMGRASKLLGRAGAALLHQSDQAGVKSVGRSTAGVKAPESFVFEGHRATAGSYVTKKKRVAPKLKGKPKNRSARRASAWKAGGGV
ncbi:uncharacterized protein PV09_01685 [Verruconis gallopava]|uniref:Nucleolar protein 12 n=1 Tax=Verruconis gallopava TaxID=253628 RepID=A0A0D1XY63_9PEZI|nr:uncharacterized protein PV09_01685 [Verruconis gallopava]KIW07756.1 hypothetical protein PV09_01685 [Verruconis gallopava]